MWLLPFLLRATPRLDLTGWSLRSEVNHDSDRAFERHTRPDPERYESRNALAQDHLSGQYALVIESAEEFVALRTSSNPEEYYRASHESALDEVWFDVIARFPAMRQWVAQNKTTSAAVMERLVNDPDPRVRYQVAMTNRVDSATLRTLATDPDETVRARVAHHKKAPVDVLESLRRDESSVVRDAALARLAKPS